MTIGAFMMSARRLGSLVGCVIALAGCESSGYGGSGSVSVHAGYYGGYYGGYYPGYWYDDDVDIDIDE